MDAVPADEAKDKHHMPTGEAQREIRVGDVVERDIDGNWFPAKVRHQMSDAVLSRGCSVLEKRVTLGGSKVVRVYENHALAPIKTSCLVDMFRPLWTQTTQKLYERDSCARTNTTICRAITV